MDSEQPKILRAGEMLHWGSAKLNYTLPDGSPLWVIQFADAATGRVFARLAPSASTLSNLAVLRSYIVANGLPVAVTTAISSLFTLRQGRLEVLPDRLKSPGKFEQTLKELGIELKSMPGRLHRAPRGVLSPSNLAQLGAALRDIRAVTIEQANRYLIERHLPRIQPKIEAWATDAHRPCPAAAALEAFKNLEPTPSRRPRARRKRSGASSRKHEWMRNFLSRPSWIE